uniref:Uncharacterized protein n=1 Tax=Physcomitrium patens TaxID=3218 RepID=A0A2K1KWQ3_PHYPA|nr:hypothetical protein PHYPA_005171 [Physcomitrium patens]
MRSYSTSYSTFLLPCAAYIAKAFRVLSSCLQMSSSRYSEHVISLPSNSCHL